MKLCLISTVGSPPRCHLRKVLNRSSTTPVIREGHGDITGTLRRRVRKGPPSHPTGPDRPDSVGSGTHGETRDVSVDDPVSTHGRLLPSPLCSPRPTPPLFLSGKEVSGPLAGVPTLLDSSSRSPVPVGGGSSRPTSQGLDLLLCGPKVLSRTVTTCPFVTPLVEKLGVKNRRI